MSNKSSKKYYLILFIIVLSELIIGTIFLYKYYQQIIDQKKQEQLRKITYIDKKNLVFPEIDEFDYYWELQKNIVTVENPYWLGHQIKCTNNADGLNERFDYKVEKPANTFRIITLGDSFTYGHYVNTKDNWPEQLEDMLNKSEDKNYDSTNFEVINLGVTGFDIPYIIKRYQDIGAKYNPDLVIWFESGSGLIRFVEKESAYEKDCLKEYEENNITVGDKEMFHPCTLKTDQHFIDYFANDYDQLNTELIDKLNEFLDTLDPNKIIFFSYTKETISSPKLLEPTIEKIHGKHENVKYLPIIEEKNKEKTRLLDDHPSEFGHELIAQTIYQYLRDNLLN